MRHRDESARGRAYSPPSLRLDFSARILFFRLSGQSVVLDCLAYPQAQDSALGTRPGAWTPGTPLSMELALPGLSWLGAAEATLGRWAEQSTMLNVELHRLPVGPRVRITDRSTSMTFETLA